MVRFIIKIGLVGGVIWFAAGTPNIFAGEDLENPGGRHGTLRGGMGKSASMRLGQ